MKTATSLFSTEDRLAIETAIAEAEKTTAGEIVPVVATVSGRYDRAEDLFGLLFALLALAATWYLFQDTTTIAWSATQSQVIGLPATAVILIVAFGIGAAIATRFPVLRLPFVTRGEMNEEVERRALETFQKRRIRSTSNGTGVLIYVSLYEHIVRVLGDDGVAEQLSSDALEEICTLVVNGLKQGQPADGLRQGVEKTGELLAQVLPPTVTNSNEIANQLILID